MCLYIYTNTHTHTHTQFSLKKKGNSDIRYDMDEPRGHYANWKKPVTKNKYCMIPLTWGTSRSQNHRDRKQNVGCQELGDGSLGGQWVYSFSLARWKSSGDGWWEGCTRIPMYLISLNCTLKNG